MKRKSNTDPAIRLPDHVRAALLEAEHGGHPAWIHGLPVLDMLHNRTPSDISILTDTSPSWSGNLKASLKHVPATALAIACDANANLSDPFGALPALKRRSVIPLSNPEYLVQDPASTLAILALSARYNLHIGPATARSIKASSHTPSDWAPVRYWLNILLTSRNAARILIDYKPFFTCLIPELQPCVDLRCSRLRHVYDVYDHMAHAVSACRTADPVVRMALFLHDIGKPDVQIETAYGLRFPRHTIASRDIADKILCRMEYPDRFRYDVLDLILYHDLSIQTTPDDIALWIRRLGTDGLIRLMEVKYADIQAHKEQTAIDLTAQWEGVRTYLSQQYIWPD